MEGLTVVEQYERTIVKLRWFFVLSIFFLLHFLKPAEIPIKTIDTLLLVAITYNLVATFLLTRRVFTVWFSHLFLFLDFCLSATAVFLTGGITSAAVPLFYLLIITAGIRFGFVQGLWIIFFTIVTYLSFFFYELKQGTLTGNLADVLLSIAFFLTAGLLGIFVGNEVKKQTKTSLKLKQVSTDLERKVTVLSTLSRMGAVLNSNLKLEEILKVVVEAVKEILEPDCITLMLYHPQDGDLTVEIAYGSMAKEVKGMKIKVGEGIAGWVAQWGQPLLLTGKEDLLFKHFESREDIKSAICMPLRVKNKTIGVLSISNLESDYCFTEEDLNFLSLLAAPGATAIANAQLFEQVVQRAKETTSLIRVSEKVGANLNLDKTLEIIVDEANKLLGTKYNSIRLINKETQELEIKMAMGLSHETLKMIPLKVGEGVMGKVAEEGKALIINDLSKEPLFDYFPKDREKVSSMISVPLIVEEEVIGVLTCASEEPKEFTHKDLRLLFAFANQAALAIQRARLYQQLQIYADALLEEHERVKTKTDIIIHSMAEGVLVTDEKLNIMLTNHACEVLLELCWEEMVGRHLINVFPIFADRFQGFDIISDLKKGKILSSFDFEWKDKVIKVNLSPIFRENGIFLGVVGLMHDVTEEKKIEKMKSEFVSIVSHELRTPMTAIKGNISMILEGIIGEVNQKIREILEDVYEGNERLIRLVEDMLSLSKIEKGCIDFNIRPISLGKIIKESVKSLASLAWSKGLTLEYEESPMDLPLVVADQDKVKQILWNLIGNAIKFTPQGGVKIKTRLSGDYILTEVSDTGIGIASEEKERIFEKYAVSVKSSNLAKGAGLGLYICKYLVEKQGGSIWVESEEAKGSTFIFSLPLERKYETARIVDENSASRKG